MYELAAGVRLHLNENLRGCSPRALNALASLRPQHLSSYPDSARAVARCARLFRVEAANVALTNGLDEGIRAIALTHLRPSRDGLAPQAIVPQPAFEIFEGITAIVGGEAVPVFPRRDFVIEADDVLAAITPRTRVVFLANPNNPTGVSMPLERIAAIAARVPPEVVVFVDEAYADFAPATFIPRLGSTPRVIVGRTFSKAYGLAGLRLGALVGAPGMLAPIRPAIGLYSVNVAALAAFEAALDDSDHFADYLHQVDESKALLYAACERLGLEYWRSDANFVLVRIGSRARQIVEGARARGVYLSDRSQLPLCHGCIRMTVGSVEETCGAIAVLTDLLNLRPSSSVPADRGRVITTIQEL